MTQARDVLLDGYGRVRDAVHRVVTGLDPDQLTARLDADANSIAWLVWHLTRIQDDHVADASGLEQVWTARGFVDRFALPLDAGDTGYGHDRDEVAAVKVGSPALLVEYHDAVYAQTTAFVGGLGDADLERVVDTRWDPPVTLAVRLVSVIADDLEHVGQAAFVRGVLERAL